MERYASAPGFEEYVEARGADLLRTAWLLAGSDEGARRLVGATLARAWPRWAHLAAVGAGSYDLELRRVLVDLHRHGHGRPGRPGQRQLPGLPAQDRRVLEELMALSPADRARVVLALFDGLADARLAAALDEPVAAAHRRREAAVGSLAAATGLDAPAIAAALDRLAPASPSLDGLTGAPVRRPSRARRLVGWAGAAVVLLGAGAVAATVAAPSVGPPSPPSTSSTRTTVASADCLRRHDAPAVPPGPTLGTSGNPVVGVVVCAQTDNDSVWTGYLPPSQALVDPRAVAMVVLARRDSGIGCGAVPQGPAFRVLAESADGHVVTYANEGLRCNGWPALDSIYRALAEQDAVRAQARWEDGFVTCPPVFDPRPRPGSVPPLARGTRFDTATLCLHPLPVSGRVPRMRPVTRLVLAQSQVQQLDAELAAHGSTRQPRPPCAASNALYVLRARTTAGRVVDLGGACPDQLGVDLSAREWLRLAPASAAMLQSGTDVSYR